MSVEPTSEPPVDLPPGRTIDLAERGTTFVRDQPTSPAASGSTSPTVFLLHGLGASADLNWWPAFGPLSELGRVLAIDHRGHGRGIRPADGRFRLAECADDVAAVCAVEGIESIVAVGYSMGGPIAQLLARRHPDLVAGLVLCATSRNFVSRRRRRLARVALPPFFSMVRALPSDPRAQLRARIMERRVPEVPFAPWLQHELDRNDRSMVLDAARAVATFSSRTWIGDLAVPAAVVVTTRDNLVPPRRQYGLAAALGAHVVECDADHLDCALQPGPFVEALVSAVGDVSGRRRDVPSR